MVLAAPIHPEPKGRDRVTDVAPSSVPLVKECF